MPLFSNEALVLDRLEVGPFMVNSYILGCQKTRIGAIIDPGDSGDQIIARAKELNLDIKYIFNTHGHVDHIIENGYVKEKTEAQIVIHKLDAPLLTDAQKNTSALLGMPVTSPPPDLFFEDGEDFNLGELTLKVFHAPGHSRGSVCLYHDPIAIVGDVLFAGSIGRTDLLGGSYDVLINSIRSKLLPLGDAVTAYPGHGPETTLGHERKTNPFLNESSAGWLQL
ncbi:MBL fold metallo-hydrolase [bacterium]|nr:MBL fold metallo-hydrolase [bacterium]MBU1651715.1 MBL fold metallo-hydrolase [bacterium]MBU1880462.1 MBL fold metallo-hydrolase [bacterium]